MKLSKVGYTVALHNRLFAQDLLELCFDNGASIGSKNLPERCAGTSLFHGQEATVFERRGDATAALNRTEKFRFKGEMKVITVRGLKARQ